MTKPNVIDNGKVRLGGFAPSLAPETKTTMDAGLVKIGGGAIQF